MPRAGRLSKAATSVRACWADPGADEAQGYPLAVLYHRAPPDSHPKSRAVLVLCNSDLFRSVYVRIAHMQPTTADSRVADHGVLPSRVAAEVRSLEA